MWNTERTGHAVNNSRACNVQVKFIASRVNVMIMIDMQSMIVNMKHPSQVHSVQSQ